MRLGRSGAPDPYHLTSVMLPGQSGSIRDLSWCEQSGCIALLVQYNISEEPVGRRIVTVDLFKPAAMSNEGPVQAQTKATGREGGEIEMLSPEGSEVVSPRPPTLLPRDDSRSL